ncbi:MAG TPA: D-alanyl-D-alanine carboxypeptidase/D-alanyl-D-alanine-endopeptidase [Pyrinomonadaceae bacterium]
MKSKISNFQLQPFFLYLRLSAFICGFIFLSSCSSSNQSNQNTQIAETPAFEVPTPQINLLKPLAVSNNPDDVALAKKIDEQIEKSEFANARWGVFVVSLKDGRVLVARDAQKLFNPASVQKILTSTVALDKLGADFRWKTAVYAQNKIEDGTLNGDLILYGQGAPDFSAEGVENLVSQLQSKGLKRIKGNVVGDESFFKGDEIGEGWSWNDLQWYYGAQASALTINFNQVTVTLQDGKPKTEPSTDYIQFSGDVKPAENGEPDAVGLKRDLAENNVYVYGNGKNLDARVAVENPALWSAKILRETLEKKGIAVEGEAKSASWKTENKTSVENANELAAIESQTLGEIVHRMNKDSVNLFAELILRTLGKRFGEEAPDENPRGQKTRGDDAAGVAVIRKWLAEKGVSFQETESIKDGSGLSRLNFVTPETIGRALIAASQMKASEIFRNSLPSAGTDGTLRGRLGNARGRILGKTGSITYVNSLAGYAKNERETLAFVILCNNETRRADSSILIDAIATSLVGN